jgi:transposase-like protein
VEESYSIRQLCVISGYSKSKLHRIKDYWLDLEPEEVIDFSRCKYLIYDGTYFHKKGCFISLMNANNQELISNIYTIKEGYKNVYVWFSDLNEKGLSPLYITMDGEKSVIRAIKEVWPQASIQRCLYHIQREGMRWLRTYPKTQAGKDLRRLLKTLCRINSFEKQDEFIDSYLEWLNQYRDFVLSLPKTEVAFKDLRKTMILIFNALPDMFHYLTDANIHKTTNTIESFYSRLKADYRKHRGLTEEHKISYLKWYCYFKNQLN